MKKVLVAEDEFSLQKILAFDLKGAGFEVTICEDGQSVLNALKHDTFDIYLLDWMLPNISGLELTEKIRKQDARAHIIMLTANAEEHHKIDAFNMGVDDYLTKPFSSRELILRISAAMKKQIYFDTQQKLETQLEQNQLFYKNLKVDLKAYKVFEDGQELILTLKEFDLLIYLIKHQGIAISRENLLTTIWGYDYDGDTRTVDVHIFKLRAKINNKDIKFKTVRGIGYLLEKQV